ncbi:hypothetical protein APHAL10511_003944 [Amanita phalloides]|nr:hypothetical protein APHAL10511_003944 [Amanita phalloides]
MEQNPPKIISKRPVGRPKGSKNKPGAGTKGNPVGRPRKNRVVPTAAARALARAGGPGPSRISHDTPPSCPALPEASPANPVIIDVPTIATSAGHHCSPKSTYAEKDDEPRERLLMRQSSIHEWPLHAPDRMHQTELTAFFTRGSEVKANDTGEEETGDAVGKTPQTKQETVGNEKSRQPEPADRQPISLGNQDDKSVGIIVDMEIAPAPYTPSRVLDATLEDTTAPPHTPSPIINAPAQSTVMILESPLPVAVRRATENVVDEAVPLRPLVGATSSTRVESSPPVALAEITSPAREPPPGLGAFDGDDDQDIEDLGQILGSSFTEDSDPQPELDDIMTTPDDDENPESAPLNTADVPSSGDEPPAAPRQEIPTPRSSIPLWLIDNYRDLCERLRTEMKQNASRQPSAYDAGQFMMVPKNPMFAAARTNHLSPRLFYEPHYFLWLPHLFNRIPCPACKATQRKNDNGSPVMLRLLGWPQAPRRVVDIDLTLYIVGYWYYCGQGDCRKTYQSWSSAIMDVLPPVVAAQFPFCLTYRCGVTDRLIALLCSSFQYGHGPRPFAEMIRSFHIRRYEQLMLQYYELVRMRKDSTLSGLLPKHLRFGAWDDRAGYAGYVPSGHYFGALYNLVIENHAKQIDQCMAMLSCCIMMIDHSFKVPKHLGKLNGKAVFGALHTGINEYVEVRTMTLTPTKAHSQFMPALATIPHSLRDYGHGDLELVFTDNVRADKNDVEPVPLSTTMECLEVPTEWPTTILESSYQISTRLNILLQLLETLPADQSIDIAMGMEWSVNQAEGIQGRIALVAIAFLPCIYLIRLSKFVSAPLLVLLRSPRIRKFGVHVKQDMTQLFNDCGFSSDDIPFTGAVELGALAQQCHFTSRANTGLVDLVNTVLHHYLPKDESICVSTAWDDETLSQAQIGYAALNVYALWALCDALLTPPTCEKVTHETAAGTPVKLLSRDRLVTVAVGFIAVGRGVQFNGVNVTKTQVIVNITSVFQPAYLICPELLKSHLEVPISSLATLQPFALLCHTKDLEITTITSLQLRNEALDLRTPLLPHPYESNYDPYSSPNDVLTQISSHASNNEPSANLDWCASLPYDAKAEQSIDESAPDPAVALLTESLSGTENILVSESTELAELAPQLLYEDSEIRTQVLGDIWHLMNQFKIPVTHGLRQPFARSLHDALFVPDQADKAAVEEILCKTSITWEHMVLWKLDWVWK